MNSAQEKDAEKKSFEVILSDREGMKIFYLRAAVAVALRSFQCRCRRRRISIGMRRRTNRKYWIIGTRR